MKGWTCGHPLLVPHGVLGELDEEQTLRDLLRCNLGPDSLS